MELRYGSKVMNPEPSNRSLEDVRMFIKQGAPQVVILEPGDATLYMFLLVPVNSIGISESLGAIGIAPSRANEYLYISKFNAEFGTGTWINTEYTVDDHDIAEVSENQHTRNILVWWLNEVLNHG